MKPTLAPDAEQSSREGVPDSAAGLAGRGVPALGRHALRHADGRNAARLRAHDAAHAAAPGLNGGVQQHLRHLSRHSRPLYVYQAVLACRPGTGWARDH